MQFIHKLRERCRTEGTRDETHGRVQLHIDLTCVSRAYVTRLGRSTLLLNSKAQSVVYQQYVTLLVYDTSDFTNEGSKCVVLHKDLWVVGTMYPRI